MTANTTPTTDNESSDNQHTTEDNTMTHTYTTDLTVESPLNHTYPETRDDVPDDWDDQLVEVLENGFLADTLAEMEADHEETGFPTEEVLNAAQTGEVVSVTSVSAADQTTYRSYDVDDDETLVEVTVPRRPTDTSRLVTALKRHGMEVVYRNLEYNAEEIDTEQYFVRPYVSGLDDNPRGLDALLEATTGDWLRLGSRRTAKVTKVEHKTDYGTPKYTVRFADSHNGGARLKCHAYDDDDRDNSWYSEDTRVTVAAEADDPYTITPDDIVLIPYMDTRQRKYSTSHDAEAFEADLVNNVDGVGEKTARQIGRQMASKGDCYADLYPRSNYSPNIGYRPDGMSRDAWGNVERYVKRRARAERLNDSTTRTYEVDLQDVFEVAGGSGGGDNEYVRIDADKVVVDNMGRWDKEKHANSEFVQLSALFNCWYDHPARWLDEDDDLFDVVVMKWERKMSQQTVSTLGHVEIEFTNPTE